MSGVDPRKLAAASRDLGDAVTDPSAWPRLMERISEAAGATGALLLQSDVRTADVPRTESVGEFVRDYFDNGWHHADIRAVRGVPRLLRGDRIVTDQDIFTRDELRALPFYNEHIVPHGYLWFAAIGFYADADLWGLSIQRRVKEGPFEPHEARLLAGLSDRLTEVATLSTAVGRIALTSAIHALDHVGLPAVAVNLNGTIVGSNETAAAVFDDHLYVKAGRLFSRDADGAARLDALFDRFRALPDTEPVVAEPIVVRRGKKRPVVIRVLPVHGAARTPFFGARAMLTFTACEVTAAADRQLLRNIFGLTEAEARLASLAAQGKSPAAMARQIGIAELTARNQLKAVFAKTGTHRQAELAALLARF